MNYNKPPIIHYKYYNKQINIIFLPLYFDIIFDHRVDSSVIEEVASNRSSKLWQSIIQNMASIKEFIYGDHSAINCYTIMDLLCANFCIINKRYKLKEQETVSLINLLIANNSNTNIGSFLNTITENNLLTFAIYYNNATLCDHLVNLVGYHHFNNYCSHKDTLYSIPKIFKIFNSDDNTNYETYNKVIIKYHKKFKLCDINNRLLYGEIIKLCKYNINSKDNIVLYNVHKYKYILYVLLLILSTKEKPNINNIVKYKIMPLLFKR